jgi:hypothetical protein
MRTSLPSSFTLLLVLFASAVGPQHAFGQVVMESVEGAQVAEPAGRPGLTVLLDLPSAPFGGEGARYDDPSVIVYIPPGFRAECIGGRASIDIVVHFHGQKAVATDILESMELREQLVESGRNAVLVVPQGPVNAVDNNWGRLHRRGGLKRLLTGVLAALSESLEFVDCGEDKSIEAVTKVFALGTVILSAHSGGYSVAARCLKAGGVPVKEVYLFDALFGRHSDFLGWLSRGRAEEPEETCRKRFLTFYARPDVARKHAEFLKLVAERKQNFQHLRDVGVLMPEQLLGNPLTLIGTKLKHMTVMHKHHHLSACLRTSCLIGIRPADSGLDP